MSNIDFNDVKEIKYKDLEVIKAYLGDKKLWEKLNKLLNLTLGYEEDSNLYGYKFPFILNGEYKFTSYSKIININTNGITDIELKAFKVNLILCRPILEDKTLVTLLCVDTLHFLDKSKNIEVEIKHSLVDNPLDSEIKSRYIIYFKGKEYITPDIKINLITGNIENFNNTSFHNLFNKYIKVVMKVNNKIYPNFARFSNFFRERVHKPFGGWNVDIDINNTLGVKLNLDNYKDTTYNNTLLNIKCEFSSDENIIEYVGSLDIAPPEFKKEKLKVLKDTYPNYLSLECTKPYFVFHPKLYNFVFGYAPEKPEWKNFDDLDFRVFLPDGTNYTYMDNSLLSTFNDSGIECRVLKYNEVENEGIPLTFINTLKNNLDKCKVYYQGVYYPIKLINLDDLKLFKSISYIGYIDNKFVSVCDYPGNINFKVSGNCVVETKEGSVIKSIRYGYNPLSIYYVDENNFDLIKEFPNEDLFLSVDLDLELCNNPPERSNISISKFPIKIKEE